MRRRRVSTQSLLCWLVGVFGSFGMAASQPAPQNPPATPSVSILQFTDPQCQACVAATEELNKLQQRYGASALTILAKPLAANAAEARALGIRTLPTLFVNGRRLEGPVDAASLGRFLDLAFGKLLADQPVALALEKAPVLASSANAAANSANVPEIVVFSDFQCPYCSSLAPQLAELAQGGEASIRFKHFPLSFHAKAPAAHRAALAAGQQGKFWEMHDRIFGAAGKLEPAAFEAYAKELDLDLSRFQQESAAGGAFDAAIQADIAEGERVGVEGTPTIFINGRQFLSKPTIANLRAALIESRKASGVLPQQAQPSQPTPLPLLTLLDGPAQLPAVEWFFDAHSQLTQASAAAVRRLLEQESRRSKSSGAGLRARVVARHMPMPFHSGSKLTHQALALASEQGKFWAFLDQVIAAVQQQQPAGAGSAEPLGADRLKSIAMRLGLDAAAFSQRLDQGAAAAAVERDLARARELSVRGVPAFVFDGKPLEGQSIDLESALASRSSAKALSTVSAAGGANTQ